MLTGIVLIVRTIISYLLMLLLIYLQKKDQNKKLLILDKVILLLIIVINSNLILNYDINVLIYIIPIITLLLLREVTRLILIDNNKVKNIFEKDPIILVKNSKIYFKNLIDHNYSIDTLLTELRKNRFYSLKDIKYVFLESDNTLSIFPYDKNKFETYPIPIILDGILNDFLLKELHLTKEKIEKMLIRDNLLIEDIYYALYENNKLFIIRKDELK